MYKLTSVIVIGFVIIVLFTMGNRIEKEYVLIEVCETEIVEKLLFQQGVVTATVYNANPKQCNKDYLTTASGLKLDSLHQYPHRVIAVSRDLLNQFNYGDSVFIKGTEIYDGWWKVEDCMNKRYNNRIDLLIDKEMPIGKWNNIYVYSK